MKKKVLVTGSAGYIGRHVVESLVDLGHEVIAVDINTSSLDDLKDKITIITDSIFDCSDDPFEKYGKPDVCIHLAWRNGFVHNADTHITDLSAHYSFLKKLVDAGIEGIAVMGTMHEVGYHEGVVDENTPCKPLSLYGISKNALRQSMLQITENTKTKLYWLRAYYILGDDTRNHSIFSKILSAVQEGKTVFPFTSGKNKYDFIDVAELGYQIALASTQDKITGIINVCDGTPRSLADVVEEFIKNNDLPIRLEYGAFPDRTYDSPAIWGNADKIKKIKANVEEN